MEEEGNRVEIGCLIQDRVDIFLKETRELIEKMWNINLFPYNPKALLTLMQKCSPF